MSNSDDLDKSEEASAHKLERARNRGGFARSQDATYLVLLFALTATVFALGKKSIVSTGLLLQHGLATMQTPVASDGIASKILALGGLAFDTLSPLLFVFLISALFGAGIQARGVLTTEPLKPDFSRLNPAQGMKRLLSIKSALDLLRSIFKLCTSFALVWFWAKNNIGRLMALAFIPAKQVAFALLAAAGEIILLFTILYILFAAIDGMIAKWDFSKQMRMSKKELKDEHKEREGDPGIKQKLRELRGETLRKAQALARIPAAAAVITNPTHYAVCLEYNEASDPAPKVSTKGQGAHALLIRKVAQRNGIPIIENPILCRAIYRSTQDGTYIAPEHYGAVARVFLWLAAAKRQAGATPQ